MVTVLASCPGLGKLLARSPLVDETQVRDLVLRYDDFSSLP